MSKLHACRATGKCPREIAMLIVTVVAELSVNPETSDTRKMEASRDAAMHGNERSQ
jgi:hypothetical protein